MLGYPIVITLLHVLFSICSCRKAAPIIMVAWEIQYVQCIPGPAFLRNCLYLVQNSWKKRVLQVKWAAVSNHAGNFSHRLGMRALSWSAVDVKSAFMRVSMRFSLHSYCENTSSSQCSLCQLYEGLQCNEIVLNSISDSMKL